MGVGVGVGVGVIARTHRTSKEHCRRSAAVRHAARKARHTRSAHRSAASTAVSAPRRHACSAVRVRVGVRVRVRVRVR
eukprot:scaffold119094_cov63-Phaeocystis_antarctica.AAC.1